MIPQNLASFSQIIPQNQASFSQMIPQNLAAFSQINQFLLNQSLLSNLHEEENQNFNRQFLFIFDRLNFLSSQINNFSQNMQNNPSSENIQTITTSEGDLNHFCQVNENSFEFVQKTTKKIEEEANLSNNEKKRPKRKKVLMKNLKCPHKKAKHYAKNMCSNCYHLKGREKKAWKCSHTNEFNYALGLCYDCYHLNRKKLKTLKNQQNQ